MLKILSTGYAKVHRTTVFVERSWPATERPSEVWQINLEIDVEALLQDVGAASVYNKTHRAGVGGRAVVARAKRER